MSYSIRNNRYTSHLTGRSYEFVKDRTGMSRRAALAKLSADEKAFREAKLARPDTPPVPPTHEQKVAAVVHVAKPETNVADSIGSRVAALERQLQMRAPWERGSIQRKINALSVRHETETYRQEAKAARQAFVESPEWIQANQDAFDVAEQLALRADPDLPEQLVRDAFENKEFLRRNQTPEGIAEYRAREVKLQEAHKAGKLKSIEISKARIAHAETAIRLAVLDAAPVLPSEQMLADDSIVPITYAGEPTPPPSKTPTLDALDRAIAK